MEKEGYLLELSRYIVLNPVKERDARIYEAVYRWGYKLKEVGGFWGLHYSKVGRIASMVAKNKT